MPDVYFYYLPQASFNSIVHFDADSFDLQVTLTDNARDGASPLARYFNEATYDAKVVRTYVAATRLCSLYVCGA